MYKLILRTTPDTCVTLRGTFDKADAYKRVEILRRKQLEVWVVPAV